MIAHTHEIVVCMGSACFSRGNASTVPEIQKFLRDNGLEGAVKVTGTLCQNQCRQGPNISLDGECLCKTPKAALLTVLEDRLNTSGGMKP